jgi:hypothetical protein
LHLKFCLALSLDALLLDVANHSGMHCLKIISSCKGLLEEGTLPLSLQFEPNAQR